MSSLEIKNRLVNGDITPEQAIEMWQGLKPREVTPYREKPKLVVNLSRVGRELFNHNNADTHYEQRMDVEEGFRHMTGLPIYAAIAAIDGALDALGFGLTEVAEDITFTTSRLISRTKDGWERGKIK